MKASAVDCFHIVGTGKRTSLKVLAEMLLNLTGSGRPIQYAPHSQANPGAQPHRLPEAREGGFRLRGEGFARRESLRGLWRKSHIAEFAARRTRAA